MSSDTESGSSRAPSPDGSLSDKLDDDLGSAHTHLVTAQANSTNDVGNPENSPLEPRRSERSRNLSLIGKESRTLELKTFLVKSISTQLVEYTKLISDIESFDLHQLEECSSTFQQGFDHICTAYKEMCVLCANKPDKSVESMFSDLSNEFETIKESMTERVAALQIQDEEEERELKEAESVLQKAKEQFAKEMQIYEELKRQRQSRRNPTPKEATPVTPQDVIVITENDTPRPLPPLASTDKVERSATPASDGLDAVRQLAESLVSTMNKATAKRTSVEPSLFTGDLLDFTDWQVDLDAYLEAENINGKERLRHLKRFVGGEAKKCINGHFVTNTNEAYLDARAMLKERYGNKQSIVRTFRNKLAAWPRIHPKDGKALREFGDFLSHIRSGMQSTPGLAILNDCQENEKLSDKLPDWLKNRWARVVAKAVKEDSYPSFSEFTSFIQDEADVMLLPISLQASNPQSKTVKQQVRTRTFKASTIEIKVLCLFCKKDSHATTQCFKLEALPYADKTKFVFDNRLCFSCLRADGHRSKDCPNKATCKRCSKPHPTAMHTFENIGRTRKDHPEERIAKPRDNSTTMNTKVSAEASQAETRKEVRCNTVRTTNDGVACMAIPVYVSAGSGKEKLVYALLDTQSDACFISKETAEFIEPRGRPEQITMSTLNGCSTQTTSKYVNIKLRGFSTNEVTSINAYEQDAITCNREQIPTAAKADATGHLQDIAEKLPPLLDIPVGLLIGTDCPQALTPLDSVPGTAGKMFAMRTMFGWTLCGGKPQNGTRSIHKTDTKDKEILNILDQEFKDTESGKVSQNDLQFVKILENGTTQTPDGNYVLPLPFKYMPTLPNNKVQAQKRLDQLIRKLKADESYKAEYFKFMQALITAGHAEEVTNTSPTDKCWYIPHFGIRHPKKKKLRVVFDASAKYNGIALNDALLQGPDHINSLVGILCRFRLEKIAICCDIQQMFHNFYVQPEHRDYLRFLWVNEDLSTCKEYRMTVHLFGATSSPGVATFGLRKLANDHRSISDKAANFLIHDFYVDDGVTSIANQREAIQLIDSARKICSKGNIRLHKFASNDRHVLATVPETERCETIQKLDLLQDHLPNERTLGLEWCIDTDRFQFVNNIKEKPTTKRGLLSTVAQVYDPLGLLAPFILKGKQLLQACTSSKEPWDQPISCDLLDDWNAWVFELQKLETVKVPRCIKPPCMVSPRYELHHFSDASLKGYAACTYLRLINPNGTTSCALLIGKSRVSPLKPITVPRLELQAAVMATRLGTMVKKELRVHVDSEHYWTDSKIVLGYIANDTKQFRMYVANRVQEIKDASSQEQWNYVATTDNPADIASRGANIDQLLQSTWFGGPLFLRQANLESYIDKHKIKGDHIENDPELETVKAMATSTIPKIQMSSRFEKFSQWKDLTRSIAALSMLPKRADNKDKKVTLADLSKAETRVIKVLQTEHYADEISQIKCQKRVGKKSSIFKLNPLLDGSGILRVGGRLDRATTLEEVERRPAIIPKDTHIAKLLVQHFHEKIHHLGRQSTLAAIRSGGFWILNASNVVKNLISSCVICSRLRKQPEQQQMGQLPPERIEQTPPFTHVGMDVFGHFMVKDRRSELKRWGLLFTCLYSRAIHIELLEELTTDAFINALRCFVAIRGPVLTLFSDQGTNFMGAQNEFQRQIDVTTDEDVRNYLIANKIEFRMNSPDASHQGGVWERMIRSVRAVLNGMAAKYKGRLGTQTLRTAFYEAASILNHRPLTTTNISSADEDIITPNHLLTMKSTQLAAPPPGKFQNDELYRRTQWKIAQQFAQEFWVAWKADYMRHLTLRQKWLSSKESVKVGDVVLLKEDNQPRNAWRWGVIEDAIKGEDGLVRNVILRLANRHLDRMGRPLAPATMLKRPIQKIVVIAKA
ncbi:uncharacterized protein [Watersipora subatra]|uniref:uncharacterized protein n=1 Tax=Watersipora subatra TaxID=2589382 RepID=UPI00355BD762